MKRLIALATLLAFGAAPARSRADTMSVFGVGSRAIGLGGAYTALSDDFSGVYYNPGALTQIEKAHVGLSYYSSTPNLKFNSREIEYKQRPEGFLLGGTQTFVQQQRFRLAFGFLVNLPTSGIILVKMPQRTEEHYPRYLNINRIFAGLALAGKVGKFFSVGVAVHQFAKFGGPIAATVPIQSGTRDPNSPHYNRVADDNFQIDLNYSIAPALGIQLYPSKHWRLGIAWRDEIYLGIDSPVKTDIGIPLTSALKPPEGEESAIPSSLLSGLPSTLEVNLPVKGKTFYEPEQLAAGFAFQTTQVLVAGDVTYYQYKAYPPTILVLGQPELPPGPGIDLLKVIDPYVAGPPIEFHFKNTLVPRVGFEYRPAPAWALRTGYSFEPSPAPKQSGETNVLWPDEHVMAIGLGVHVLDLFAPDQKLRLDLHGQLRVLPAWRNNKSRSELIASSMGLKGMSAADLEKEENQDDIEKALENNPGYPSFTAKGIILASGLTISFFY
ncbi:MAG: hypothetical protein HYT87_10660 [Nitrospirae bacterium]|nr:hypothetical protein [Nitrospirota bacterium]